MHAVYKELCLVYADKEEIIPEVPNWPTYPGVFKEQPWEDWITRPYYLPKIT